MNPSRLSTFYLVCVTVIFTILATAQAEDVTETTEDVTQQSQRALYIQFANDLLTVNANDVLLKELLQEIASQSGLTVEGTESLENRVTIQFDRLALDEAMRLILHRQSYALVYAPKTPEGSQTAVLGLKMLKIVSEGGEEFLSKNKDPSNKSHVYPRPAGGAYR